jgi:hypothetical protein
VGCAVAYTGIYGEGDWREVQSVLPLLQPDDPSVSRISLQQALDLSFPAGGTAELGGHAIDAEQVNVAIKDPEDGAIIAEGTAPTGDFGRWTIALPIPEDAPDFVIVDISLGDGSAEPDYIYSTGATVTHG